MSGEESAKPRRYKGINKVSKTLADGTVKVYRYDRRSGRQLRGRPGSKEFDESLKSARSAVPTHADTFNDLVTMFKAAAEYTSKADKTKKDYDRYLDELRDEFGDMPIEALEDKRVRREFYAWRDKRADKPRAADYGWAVLRRVLSIAKKRGQVAINHAEDPGTLYTSDRSDKIPTPEQFGAILNAAYPEFRNVVLAAVCTMLREGDLCRLSWSHDKGDLIRFKTQKRNRTALVPVHAFTRSLLDGIKARRHAAVVLTTKTGVSWKPDYIRDQWRDTLIAAGLAGEDLHFHDLRGLGITLAGEAGATPQMIAAATGLSIKQVETILDRYSARTPRLAAAMRRAIENEGSIFLQTAAAKSCKPGEGEVS